MIRGHRQRSASLYLVQALPVAEQLARERGGASPGAPRQRVNARNQLLSVIHAA